MTHQAICLPARSVRPFPLLLLVLFLPVSPAAAGQLLISDFDDGTRTGWTTIPVFNGTLDAQATGGNPGGFMFATDNASGGFLFVRYFAETFDLRSAAGLKWDELVFDNGSNTIKPTRPLLIGPDDTIYLHDLPLEQVGSWDTRSVDFQEENWSLQSGASSFDVVLREAQLGFTMDTANSAGGTESGIDNVILLTGPSAIVPEPGMLPAVLLGLLLLGKQGIPGRHRRRRTEACPNAEGRLRA